MIHPLSLIFLSGGACPPVEESVLNFWKEALRFEGMVTPGEFCDVLIMYKAENFLELVGVCFPRMKTGPDNEKL
ncbi:hypothetical protein J2129_000516 [Methanofollis sp. W23]|nr:hypothetical protein [Methanofollis sp. W23]